MKTAAIRLGLFALCCVCARCWCYELATHARVTLEAYRQSSLQADPTKLIELGIPSLKYSVLANQYFDVSGLITQRRYSYRFDYDQEKMPDVSAPAGDGKGPSRVSGWLMRGAVREDDSGRTVGEYYNLFDEQEPEDDPYSNINRWCNHFYNPLLNEPLTDPNAQLVCLSETYGSAPVWASGAIDPFANQTQEKTDRRNHFTIYDARESMWRAITGYDRSHRLVAPTAIDRKAYWATTFRSLGDVLHLNQDMAQPQHTRNESHGTSPSNDYEKYIDARSKGETIFKIAGRTVSPSTMAALRYTGYQIPRFNHYSKYWSTSPGVGTLLGKGLADYSSRGFFTPANNLRDATFPQPPHDLNNYGHMPIVTGDGWREEYLVAAVSDTYLAQQSSTVRMTRASAWDDGLVASEGTPTAATFSMDQGTYDDRATLLLPRAVAYSAGLLDYIFNGRLTIALPDAGAYALADHSTGKGFTKVQLKLTNSTPPLLNDGVQYPQHMLGGTFVAIVKFHNNKCYQADLSGEYGAPGVAFDTCRDRLPSQSSPPLDFDDSAESIAVSATKSLTLNAGATVPLDFDFSSSPIPFGATDVYLQVAYRGPLGPDIQSGEQDVVVVGTKDISEPTYFSYFNASDYIHIGTSVYTRDDVAASPALLAKVRPTACVTGGALSRRLRDDCLRPFDVTIKFSFGDPGDPQVVVPSLPPRRYLRFAVLTDPAVPPGAAKSVVEEPRVLKVGIDTADPDIEKATEKAWLNQQGTCPPFAPIEVLPIRNQLLFDSDPPAFTNSAGALSRVRGVYGDTQVACVVNGDASALNANDNREAVMLPLTPNTAEVTPLPLVISPAFLGP